MWTMDDEITALEDQQRELDDLLAGRPESDWQLPSRCEGWTVADVMTHLAQSSEFAMASARGGFGEAIGGMMAGLGTPTSMDDAVEAMVAQDRDETVTEIRKRWEAAAAGQVAALRARDPRDRVEWVMGEFSARTLATTRLAEVWIHTGDVAWAFGTTPEPTDRLRPIARLAWRTLPHAFRITGIEMTGPVAFHLTGPGGDAWDFEGDEPALTTITGSAAELCSVAARRLPASETALEGTGPDAEAVLEVVRTWA